MWKKQADIHDDDALANDPDVARDDPKAIADDSKDYLRESLNNRISYLCRLAALIIAVVIFATTILGQDNMSFVILGLSLSVALLAIAGLQHRIKPKR